MIDNAVTVASGVTLSIGENVSVFTNALMETGMISLLMASTANRSQFTVLQKFQRIGGRLTHNCPGIWKLYSI